MADLEDVQFFTGLLTRPYQFLSGRGVRVMSGFFGPVERAARAAGAAVEYVAADFHGLERLAVRLRPRVVLAAVTPPDADGAAVAAVTAHYLVDLRAQDPQREHLLLYTNQLLATVARRHSGVDGQEAFNRWIEDMELNDPALFLPRLRNVVDVLVQDEWWFDRDALQAALPAD